MSLNPSIIETETDLLEHRGTSVEESSAPEITGIVFLLLHLIIHVINHLEYTNILVLQNAKEAHKLYMNSTQLKKAKFLHLSEKLFSCNYNPKLAFDLTHLKVYTAATESILFSHTVELQWLEHLWNHGNMFETWVVQANEC